MSGVRALTGPEHEAFRLARLVSAEVCPYFMHALFAAQPVAAPGLGTFAVDARWRLYLDPEQLVGARAWPTPLAGAVLLHEVGHLVRQHADRAEALPHPVDASRWNWAADAEINDDLLAAGVVLPEGVVAPESFGCAAGGVAEDYYAALGDPSSPWADDEDGDGPGCGSGAGGVGWPGECAADAVTESPGLDAAEADLVRRNVAHAVRETGGVGRGSAPQGVLRWAERVLTPPTVSWDRLLRALVRRAVADAAGRTDYTYARPSRRRVPGVVLPAMRAPSLGVSLVVDTSGSMRAIDLDAAMSETVGVLRSAGVARDRVLILACDAATTVPQRVRSIREVRLVGGGGTDMRVGIAAAQAARPAPQVVVVFTDGDTPWPAVPARARLVCAVIGNPHAQTPPWARTVHITPAA